MFNKNQKTLVAVIIVSSIAIIQMSCSPKTPSDLGKAPLIPKPVLIVSTGDIFTLKANTDIYVQEGSDELKQIGQMVAAGLKQSTGFEIDVIATDTPPKAGIFLSLSDVATDPGGDEAYEITITKKLITLSAGKPEGLFRGTQTIRQLLPAEIELTVPQEGPWEIATGTISDYPVYSYRGTMLDVARHFFGVEDVKRFIDFLTLYKMNVFHLHLSDDQGWRIEIKSWPNLTLHGGTTQVGGGQGGYYTQDQYSDIVNYAKERYITIVPEIDMPGHTNAALASYPGLNCSGKAPGLYTGTNVGFSTLCTRNEITYKFIDDVIRELSALTPGPYIHIGGDESHVTKIEDYIPFINRVQDIVTSHGKKVLGWDEIALSTLKPNSVAQVWASVKNANLAVGQGAKILMSPASKAYIDMQYNRESPLGLHWAAYIEVDSAYIWDPSTLIPGVVRENIIGIEAPLWTETITKMDDIEYMVFPRLPGYAEIGWTPVSERSWEEYKLRLAQHGERFKAMNINFYQSNLIPWGSIQN
ncbi:MAG: beta-N-acetylhexosaminidase [Bacteroidales bacterium]